MCNYTRAVGLTFAPAVGGGPSGFRNRSGGTRVGNGQAPQRLHIACCALPGAPKKNRLLNEEAVCVGTTLEQFLKRNIVIHI